jgi:hypothetical protein
MIFFSCPEILIFFAYHRRSDDLLLLPGDPYLLACHEKT